MTTRDMTTRRRLIAGLALAAPALAFGRAAQAAPVLRAGDQKGGTQSLMKAAGVLDGLSAYRIEWSQFSAAAPLLEALNADAVDLAFASDAPTTFALAAGLPARIVSPVRTSGAGTAILVRKDSPIRSVADLKGRTVATNRGSVGHALVLSVAAAQGWKPGDVTLANLLPAEAKGALSSGAVDAWSSWGVYVAEARLVDEARVVVDGGNGLLTGLSYLIATDGAIAGKRVALLDFCRRLALARRWARAHPDDYARVLAADIGVSQPVARMMFDTEKPVPVAIDERVIVDEQTTIDRYLAAGLVHTRLDAPRLFDTTFNQALAG